MTNAGKTAITRTKLSAPVKWLVHNGYLHPMFKTLDYGSGKGYDAKFLGFSAYDPNHGPYEIHGRFDIITCTYVLNTVPEEEREAILADIYWHLTPGGRAYITVRRDIKKPTWTKRGTFQDSVHLEHRSIHKTSGYEIYTFRKDYDEK